MQEFRLTIHPFRMGEDKEAAVKVVEEAAEAYGAAQSCRDCNPSDYCQECAGKPDPYCDTVVYLADEIADVIQAACNLAARYDIDLGAAMRHCERRNRARGRYAEADDGDNEGR